MKQTGCNFNKGQRRKSAVVYAAYARKIMTENRKFHHFLNFARTHCNCKRGQRRKSAVVDDAYARNTYDR